MSQIIIIIIIIIIIRHLSWLGTTVRPEFPTFLQLEHKCHKNGRYLPIRMYRPRIQTLCGRQSGWQVGSRYLQQLSTQSEVPTYQPKVFLSPHFSHSVFDSMLSSSPSSAAAAPVVA